MVSAPEFQVVRPGLFFWQAYDPAVKADLCCCAFETPAGLVFCDPVGLDALALGELVEGRTPAGILLTNGNHERSAGRLAKKLGLEIWANAGVRAEVAATHWFEEGDRVLGAEAISLKGFAPGETAFWIDGLLVIGDAVINVPPYGFSILPEKYCEDAKLARESLKKLSRLTVQVMIFAHGLPIVSGAQDRLAALVA